MPGNSYIVALPTMTQTTSAVDTSTGAVPAWDVSDAMAITITCANATTAPGPKIQVALTSDPAATFFFLCYNTSGASQIITTSGLAMTLPVTAFKQVRVISTTVVTANTVHNANKQVMI